MSQWVHAALGYLRRGCSVVPLCYPARRGCLQHGPDCPHPGKRPLMNWEQRQRQRATEEEVRAWAARWPQANIGVVTGRLSGLVVLDVDGEEGLASLRQRGELPPTLTARTGRGAHLYYRHPGETPVPSRTAILPGVDVRGDGGVVIVPPSLHASGVRYRWDEDSKAHGLAEPPEWLMELLRAPAGGDGHAPLDVSAVLAGVPEGTRNVNLFRLAAKLRAADVPQAWAEHLVLEAAANCQPPLPEQEARGVVRSAYARYAPRSNGAGDALEAEPWEPPVPLLRHAVPPFPVDALPTWLQDFVAAVSAATQTPPDLAGLLGLAAVATAVQGRLVVQVRPGWTEPLGCFVVVALPPGTRKTAVFQEVTAPLAAWERAEAERRAPEVAEAQARRRTAEQRLAHLEGRAARAAPEEAGALAADVAAAARALSSLTVPALPRLLADDATPEAVARLLAEQGGRLALFSDEGDVFDLMRARYGNSPNFGVYLRAHAGSPLRVDRVGRPPTFVETPTLTIGLAVQPEVVRGLAGEPSLRGRGLLARLWYSWPASPLGRRTPCAPAVPTAVRQAYWAALGRLLALPAGTDGAGRPAPHVLTLSPEAHARLVAFEQWLEPQLAEHADLGSLADWAGKLAGAVVRLAGLLHCAEHADQAAPWGAPIEAPLLERAERLGRYLLAHAQYTFAEMGADARLDDARYLVARLVAVGATQFTKRDALRWARRLPTADALDGALRVLEAHGYVRQRPSLERSGPGRRPSPTYELHPAVASRGAGEDFVLSVLFVTSGEGGCQGERAAPEPEPAPRAQAEAPPDARPPGPACGTGGPSPSGQAAPPEGPLPGGAPPDKKDKKDKIPDSAGGMGRDGGPAPRDKKDRKDKIPDVSRHDDTPSRGETNSPPPEAGALQEDDSHTHGQAVANFSPGKLESTRGAICPPEGTRVDENGAGTNAPGLPAGGGASEARAPAARWLADGSGWLLPDGRVLPWRPGLTPCPECGGPSELGALCPLCYVAKHGPPRPGSKPCPTCATIGRLTWMPDDEHAVCLLCEKNAWPDRGSPDGEPHPRA